MAIIHSDIRFAFRVASAFLSLRPDIISRGFFATTSRSWVAVRAFNSGNDVTLVNKVMNKPSICTADELHYVSIANSDWRLALWRYTPPPHAPPRNHPLLLLSGVGTNAIGYDLSPESSFARHMSSQGFDTWVLEVRGAGLSIRVSDSKQVDQNQTANAISDKMEAVASSAANSILPAIEESSNGSGGVSKSEFSELEGGLLPSSTQLDELELKSKLADTSMNFSERLSGILSDGQLKLTTAFRKGGLCNREGTFFYKDHLHKTNVPILALAGDQDLICPPDAVYETAKLVPKHLITYQVFGEPDGPHYAHYDLVGGKLAREQLHHRIIEFLSKHDSIG